MIGISYDGSSFRSSSYGLGYNSVVSDDSTLLPADSPSEAYDLQVVAINEVISILYVDNNQLASSAQMDINVGSVKNDTGSYPFSRLSSFLSSGGKFYLYHQLDARTVAESIYDPEGTWSVNSLTVPNN